MTGDERLHQHGYSYYIDLLGGILADYEPELEQVRTRIGVPCQFMDAARREFLPTVRAALVRQAADNSDGAAYAGAVSEYAALERDQLPEAVRAVTSGRG